MKKRWLLLMIAFSLFPAAASAQANPGDVVCTAVDESGQTLFAIAGEISEGDEYISKDNILYRIDSVNGATAIAVRIGEEDMPDVSWLDAGEAQAVFAGMDTGIPAAAKNTDAADSRKLIAMYVTHSDESYIPSDGTQSIEGQGGIYDVARSFRDALQAKGIDVILDESTHLPHDSGAYRRSRRTAERLLQKRPDAIIDIHRDGIPDPAEYTTTIQGENASQVRLLVGRGNQNSDVNRAFAKQIKAVADRKYPGLIKDIFIGKGNYNQDLSPNAILLEFGTHTISKERVLNSTDVMADVVSSTLYGPETGSAKSSDAVSGSAAMKEKNKGSLSGIMLLGAIVIIGVVAFACIQTGSVKGMGTKIGRNIREMTGGLIGKAKEKYKK
ncbi:MAG: stage II sporulation protein P [Clostridia bacterium]|nr:stage II sporulation protein P [Clostridia bacterium]